MCLSKQIKNEIPKNEIENIEKNFILSLLPIRINNNNNNNNNKNKKCFCGQKYE